MAGSTQMPISPQEQIYIPEMEIMEMPARLDSDTGLQIEEDILLCIQSGAREMLLDCGKMDYITGSGTQSLLRLAREMKDVGGKLAVCNLQPQVKQMFEMCGFESVISVYDDLTTAKIQMVA
jgi:anti-anti-sigma factor